MTSYEKQRSQYDYDELLGKIESLENRLNSIEKFLRIEWIGKEESDEIELKLKEESLGNNTESTVVEYGLAWMGSIVLLFSIIFLMSFLNNSGYIFTSRIIAYLASLLLIPVALFMRRNFPILANALTICIPLLLYYITLSLFYFTQPPIISSQLLLTVLLLVIVGGQFYLALKKNSQFLTSIALFLLIATALFADATYGTLGIILLTAIVSLYLFFQRQWWQLMIFSLFLVYLAHLLWLFNNPIAGNEIRIIDSPQFNILFLFGYGIVYASSIFISKAKLESNGILISTTIWNALMFSFLLLMIVLPFYSENYGLICSAIALFCIVFSIFLKIRVDRSFAPATYACFGFMALSTSIYGFTGLPQTYFLLVLQSFLVVSMALWFRSRIIVIANAFLFVSILILYIVTSEHTASINFAFALTALATARILNWKKERLTLKTEMYRNIFLTISFFMILYSFSSALPDHYVTLSWTGVAIGFFILSVILKNIKYRYMSIMTIVVTGGHLFFVDLGQLEIGYRVVAFLVFAIISLGVSYYYSKRLHNRTH